MSAAKCAAAIGILAFIAGLTASAAAASDNNIGHENGLLNPLVSGGWFNAIVQVYTQTLGPIFHAMIFLVGPLLIGIKYQSMIPLSMALLVSGIVFAALFPADMQFIFSVAAILGLAGILYGVVHK